MQHFLGVSHRLDVGFFDGVFGVFESSFDLLRVFLRDLVAVLCEKFLCLVNEVVGLVLLLDLLAAFFVVFDVELGGLAHLLDFLLTQPAGSSNRDRSLLAGRHVLRRNVQDAVRIDIESHFDLRHASRSRRDADEVETPEGPIVPCHRPLALQDVDLDLGLVVGRGREHFALFVRNGRVALDELGGEVPEGLDPERQRGDVEEQQVLDFTTQNARLHGGAEGHDLVGIHAFVGLLAEQLLHYLLDFRHAGRAAHEDNLLDLGGFEPRVFDRLLARRDRFLEQVVDQLLELRAGQTLGHVLRPSRVRGDERQVDLGLHRRRQLNLRLFSGFLETLQSHAIFGEIDALGVRELVDEPIDDPLVDVVTTEMRVSVRRLHFHDAFADFEDRDVERATTEVEDGYLLVFLFVEAIGERRGGGLVDESHHFEARDLARVLGRLALAVIEISRDGDDRFFDFGAEVVLGRLLELLQHHRGDFGR